MKIPEIETTHLVRSCPCCGLDIVARVTIRATPGTPSVGPDGTVDLPVTSELTRFNVNHNCTGRVVADDGDPA